MTPPLNNIENFWSLMKRGVIRKFHNVSTEYLPYSQDLRSTHDFSGRKQSFILDTTLDQTARAPGSAFAPPVRCAEIGDPIIKKPAEAETKTERADRKARVKSC